VYLKLRWTNKLKYKETVDSIGEELGRLYSTFSKLAKKNINKISKLEVISDVSKVTPDGAVGLFYPEKNIIRLAGKNFANKRPALRFNEFSVGKDANSILRHEYGHNIYYSSVQDSRVWDAFYKEKGGDYFKKNISLYGSTNKEEAFAETFAAYTSPLYGKPIVKGKYLLMPEEIEKVMEQIIGKRL
jgi:hypothetical protein